MPSIKCPQCNLVNFSTELNCKRCGNPLSEYAPFAEQRAFQTAVEPNYQTQGFVPNAAHNFQTQGFQPPAAFQNQTAPYHPQQMPPAPAAYQNRYEPPPLSSIKCGERREVYMQNFKKNYIPPVCFFGAFLGLLPAAILIAVLQVDHYLTVPFCGHCWSKFNQIKTIETLTSIGALLVMIGAVVIGVVSQSLFVFLLVFAGAIALIVYGQRFKSKNSPKFKKVNRREVVITDPIFGDVSFVR
jgi:hypothetical protein